MRPIVGLAGSLPVRLPKILYLQSQWDTIRKPTTNRLSGPRCFGNDPIEDFSKGFHFQGHVEHDAIG